MVSAAFGRPNEAQLVERIRASDHYVRELSLVAEQDGAIVGHVMFSHVVLEGDEERPVLALAPVSVAPAHQRQGIGSALVRMGLEKADARREPLVTVLGDPAYYARFGFQPARRYAIEPPSAAIPDAAFMVITLPGYQDHHRGKIVYPPAFNVT